MNNRCLHIKLLNLIFAVIIFTSILSCKKEVISDPLIMVNYTYYNISNYEIAIELYDSNQKFIIEYFIMPNESLLLKYKGMGGSPPFNFDKSIGKPDSVYIAFSNLRYISYTSKYSQSNILFDYSYNCNDDNDSTRTCNWIFSDTDFENARDIIQ